ncbi:MAG: NAD(+)/NADH kinase [Firmicutes bacterium]|nr:NAD(+)/NADH kinase [Bacillota bacterium]
MENKKVFIHANTTEMSKKIEAKLRSKLVKSGLRVYEDLDADTELIICVGGDGTLLYMLHENDFPETPIVGVNTGHLGFFQEILPEKIDDFIFNYNQGNYEIQAYYTAFATVVTDHGTFTHTALNEIAVKGEPTYPVNLNISINESFIERFSGDGICVATPAGSTGYNYSLGGSIVDPRLNLLQVTPIAPMNSIAYRSFTSSILLPDNDKLMVLPCDDTDRRLTVIFDGRLSEYDDVISITIGLSDRKVNLVRFDNADFWEKVKGKFL